MTHLFAIDLDILPENKRPLFVADPMGGIAHRVQHLPYVADVGLKQGQRHGDADRLLVGTSEAENDEACPVIVDEGADLQVVRTRRGYHYFVHVHASCDERGIVANMETESTASEGDA